MLRHFLDLLFPAECIACGAEGSGLCNRCFAFQPPTRFAIADLPCVAVGAYEGALRRAVLGLKSGRRDVAQALAERLGPCIDPAVAGILVPVPTTPARRRERGFDQADLLARLVARRCGFRAAPILRQTAGDAQRGRSRTQRLAAVERFACRGASLSSGLRVLLVDDVATTGASLRDCARALRGAGFVPAGAVVVARADDASPSPSKELPLHAEGRLEGSRARRERSHPGR
jgi:ComF family protein